MFTTYASIDESGQGSAVERGASPARARRRIARGGATSVAPVWFVIASILSLPRRGGRARGTSRGGRGDGADHPQASADHGAGVAGVCAKQWLDHWSDRGPCAGGPSGGAPDAWPEGVSRAA